MEGGSGSSFSGEGLPSVSSGRGRVVVSARKSPNMCSAAPTAPQRFPPRRQLACPAEVEKNRRTANATAAIAKRSSPIFFKWK